MRQRPGGDPQAEPGPSAFDMIEVAINNRLPGRGRPTARRNRAASR
jgi:hypothetical protein